MLCMTGSLTTSSSCQCVSLPVLPGDGLVLPFPVVVQNCTHGRRSQGYKMLMIIVPGSGSHACFPASFNIYHMVMHLAPTVLSCANCCTRAQVDGPCLKLICKPWHILKHSKEERNIVTRHKGERCRKHGKNVRLAVSITSRGHSTPSALSTG